MIETCSFYNKLQISIPVSCSFLLKFNTDVESCTFTLKVVISTINYN